ncbi:MAG: sugar phosphate nucleotidyltransferase [Gemmatimonadota bacterium]
MVLAGGVGSRFWPVSTPARPKQLLPLASDRPLIADTVARTTPLIPLERLRILTGAGLVGPIREAVPGLDRDHMLVEPVARSTAPVLVWAAHELVRRDPDAVMASLHADHAITPPDVFRAQLDRLLAFAAVHDVLLTIGVRPDRPETGYGYIHIGETLPGQQEVHAVRSFVEKPDAATAERYLADGDHLWNSGIFIWRAAFFLDQVRRHTPELAELLPLLDAGDVDEYFRRAPTLSVDVGVLERSDAVAVAPAAFRWDDVGTWDALGRSLPTDAAGNVSIGPAHAVDASGCITWADGDGPIVLFGTQDLVVVRTGEVTLVAPRARAADLKRLLAELPSPLRSLGEAG